MESFKSYCKDRLTELSAVEMCTQGMHWELLYILQEIKPCTFEELATLAHDMELSIANRGTKDFPVPEVRKDKKETKSAENVMKSTVKESMVVNMTPLKFSKRKEGRAEKKDDGSERQRLTLKERHEKVYPFPDLDITDMLEQLLEKQLIQLPECKQPEQAGKIELDLEEVAQTNYAVVTIMSEALSPRLIFKQRESLVQFGNFEPVVVQFHQELAPEDSREKERSIEEDDEGWIVVTRRKKKKVNSDPKKSLASTKIGGNKAQKNKKKKMTRKLKLVHEENKDFPRPQRLVTLVDFFPTRFFCDHQDENPGVVACHAINATEEESIPLRSLEEEGVSKDLSRFNVDDLLSLISRNQSHPYQCIVEFSSIKFECSATYGSTLYCMSIDFSDEDLLLRSKLYNRPFVKKVEADSNPFSKAESHFADVKFYLKNDNSPEVVPIEIYLGEASTSTTKSMILIDEKTSNPPILHYIPLSRHKKGESPFVKSPQGLKVGDIEVIKESFTTLLTKITKQEIKIDLIEAILPQRQTKDGFDPNAYKLMVKAGYDFTTHTEKGLGYRSPEPIRIIRKGKEKVVDNNHITLEEVDSMEEKEGSHVKTGSSIDIKKKEPTSRMSVWHRIKHIDVENYHGKEFPYESLKDGGQSTVDELKEMNLGTIEEPRPTFISASLSSEEEGKYMSLLTEYKDIFAWSYKEMPGLDPKIEVEVNKLIEVGFIREVKYLKWIANIVPVRKKNGQLRVCVNFRDLNNACPKDDFPLPITEIMVDATTGYEALSFMDRSSEYNKIQMALSDEEMTAFRTPKGIYCYKVMPFGLKNVGTTYQCAMKKVFDDMLHKMNPLKCVFGVTSGKFLGFIEKSVGTLLAQEEEKGKERALYYLSTTLVEAEVSYSPIEKMCLALFFAIDKLRHYMQAFTIHLVAKADPIKYAIKGKALADHPIPSDWKLCEDLSDDEVFFTKVMEPWTMYFDGATRRNGVRSGIVLISPEKDMCPIVLRSLNCAQTIWLNIRP
ncbi:uncharacterized protein E6C27_scaffold468G001830 [Cucumis melo var. makuwa]|uniref:Reverse transcriptase/retrotransposon-derived protein RNase H-like domain-containing protein n=1 Tax=Cucumis melo var. makuwa TaxID=1194695 RepID=A0A5A7V9E7_CUCMM|nr:uncharacterized protein E6C27_scaffold468G001830 [Cucumis melo var. makuwa]